jgi:hypothetical protein
MLVLLALAMCVSLLSATVWGAELKTDAPAENSASQQSTEPENGEETEFTQEVSSNCIRMTKALSQNRQSLQRKSSDL